ncbi:MAG TPA: DUF2155 domain-containing protein [Xanthobacteraceae bacterium]|nr:DUF2155 domain-containing protein [Xanthobacteraceae bacterium]
MTRIAAFLIVIGALVSPAQAQFGNIFSNDSPPRPPGNVPGFPAQPPPVQYPGQQSYPSQQYPAQPQYSPPPQQYQVPPQQASRPPQSNIQARPLAPPPGATSAPPPQQATVPPRPLPGPGGPAPANPPPPQPADTSPQSDDTVVTYTPTQKIENRRAVFSGLDKITGRIISFDAAIGETVQFGALQVTARACNTRPPTEPTNTDAYVEVDEVTLQGEIKRIFTGWMFASSPGLHAVEHPIYDVWLTDCAQPIGGAVAQTTPPPAAGFAPPGATPKARQAPTQRPGPTMLPTPPPVTDD